MKATKFIVLAGGILGILAFFLPMASVHRGDYTGTLSAFQVVKGVGAAQGSSDLAGMKGIILGLFVPGFLLAAIGAVAFLRKKFERVAGTFSFLFGLITLGLGVLLRGAAEGDAGVALTLLVVTGLAGAVGGIMGLVKPDRGEVKPTTRPLVPVAV